MAELKIDKKTIERLFQDEESGFLIPDYQRPYSWENTECKTLWDDLVSFAIPNNNRDQFKKDAKYYLGSIVTFVNKEKDNKKEIIDGQQRLTTLMLLLRVFYTKFEGMNDNFSVETRKNIKKCLWKLSEEGEIKADSALKIDSEVAMDEDKKEFIEILKTGNVLKDQKSQYAENYRFFQKCIEDFITNQAPNLSYLASRIMNNCILLPIESENEDDALNIFSTLNDRGKPLSDADIFKAQFYKFYASIGKKQEFMKKWKDLESKCKDIFDSNRETPMDELFTQYMYYIRAKKGIKDTTTEGLRKFYENYDAKEKYAIFKKEDTFENLVALAYFWNDISRLNEDKFTDKIRRRLFVLNYAPNGMWAYLVSVYFMQNKDSEGMLEEDKFYKFLNKIIGFIWTYAITKPGVNELRTPVYPEMINIVNNEEVKFDDYKFNENEIKNILSNFSFNNNKPITKSMVAWWAYQDDKQELLIDTKLQVEHIYARSRQEQDQLLSDPNNLEVLGNKVLLERRINIRASDYAFEQKKKKYLGRSEKDATKIKELKDLANSDKIDFTEEDIKNRTKLIVGKFIEFLRDNQLTK